MSENNDKELLKDAVFPSNSKTRKTTEQPQITGRPDEKRLEKVITGTAKIKKRSFGKKMAETFLEDDTKSVGSYIVHDVLIPALKSLVYDTFVGGLEMSLFGDRRPRSSSIRRDGGRSYISYGSYFRSNDSRDRPASGREISKTARARHDFGEVILDTRGEAEDILSRMVDLIADYGQATVADLYDMVGITGEFTDNRYGWTDLRSASVSRVREGYLINLPRTQPLD